MAGKSNKDKTTTLSIVIPVYNEEATVKQILERVSAVKLKGIKVQTIIVNDGSTDRTADILEKLNLGPNMIILMHTKNRGKGEAVKTAMKVATGEIVIIQDADLEYNPKDYSRLIAPVVNGKEDVVYGSRFLDKEFVFWGPDATPFLSHFIGNKIIIFFTNTLFGSNLTDIETGYKVFKREVWNKFRLLSTRFDFEAEITAKILLSGFHIHEVPISFSPRTYKEGKKITWKDGISTLIVLLKLGLPRWFI